MASNILQCISCKKYFIAKTKVKKYCSKNCNYRYLKIPLLAIKNSEILDLPNERWKPILSLDGRYKVSNMGRIKSVFRKHKILIPCNNGNGYFYFKAIHKCGKRSNYYIHIAVSESFLVKPKDKYQVNHKNMKKSDNRMINLEWVTQKENNVHARLNRDFINSERLTRILLERNKTLTSRKVIDSETGIIYNSIIEASKKIGLSYDMLKLSLRGKSKKYTNFKYYFS